MAIRTTVRGVEEEFEEVLLHAVEGTQCVVYYAEGAPQCHSGRRHPECAVNAVLGVIDEYYVPRRRVRRAAQQVFAYVRAVLRSS